MYFIYALVDPRTEKIRYIGIAKNMKQRFNQHMRGKGGNSEKDNWIQELLDDGLMPSFRVLETVETESAVYEREAHWIHYYAEQGEQLTNISLHNKQRRAVPRPRNRFSGPEYYCSEEEIAEELCIPGRMVASADECDWG